MSLLLQIALALVVASGIGFGVWNQKHKETVREEQAAMYDQAQVDAQANVTLSNGSTNADLDADIQAIDSQLKVVNDSSLEVDQSFNDKPLTD